MLGRLPARYRLTIWIAGLATFATGGAWLAVATSLPIMWPSGAVVGGLLGAVLVSGWLHLLEGTPARQPVDRRR